MLSVIPYMLAQILNLNTVPTHMLNDDRQMDSVMSSILAGIFNLNTEQTHTLKVCDL